MGARGKFLRRTTTRISRPQPIGSRHSSLDYPLRVAPESTKIVTDVGYVPLPTPALVSQAARFDKGVTGSVLGGHGSITGVKLDTFDNWEKERDRIRSELVQ